MAHELIFYLSAAKDLLAERDLINRAIAEIPADLRWQIVQSPLRDGEVDRNAIEQSFCHLLLLGGDIRAPIGLEWLIARQAGRLPTCLLKQGINRTSAAIDFQKFVELEKGWERFESEGDCRKIVLETVAGELQKQALQIGLTAAEYDRIGRWLDELEGDSEEQLQGRRSSRLGESTVILSESRLEPPGGQLLEERSDRSDA